MLTVDDYARFAGRIRDGMSIREIARTFHHSRRKIREILGEPEPKPYTRSQAAAVDPRSFQAAHRRHPAGRRAGPAQAAAHRRARSSAGCAPSTATPAATTRSAATSAASAATAARRSSRWTTTPASALEADFGHIHVDFPDGRRLVPVLLVTWSYSNCPFALALPTERTEAILHGLVEAFAFFGCVPREVWWDNPTTVAAHIFKGRERRLNDRYAALASHYTFAPLFCMPAARQREAARREPGARPAAAVGHAGAAGRATWPR